MSKVNTQHDPLARKYLLDIEVAKVFLQTHVSSEILAKCNLQSLTIEAGSYIDEDLATYISDVLYRVDLKDQASCVYFYTLVEHQSSSERLMPLRVLKYQLSILQNYVDTHKIKNNEKELLPLVLPIVFYNGQRSPYPYTANIEELFVDQELYKQIGLGNFKLVDLTVIPEQELLAHQGKLAILEILLKHIRVRDFRKVLQSIAEAIELARLDHINPGLLYGAYSYLITAREKDEINQLSQTLKTKYPDYKEDEIMTFAEELERDGIQKGMQIGEQRGMQLGKQEGKQEAQQEIARQLLNSGIDPKIIMQATHLTEVQLKSLN